MPASDGSLAVRTADAIRAVSASAIDLGDASMPEPAVHVANVTAHLIERRSRGDAVLYAIRGVGNL